MTIEPDKLKFRTKWGEAEATGRWTIIALLLFLGGLLYLGLA